MDRLKGNKLNILYALPAGIILYLLYIRLRLIFSYSTDLDGTEFIFAHVVQRIMQGSPLYPNPLEFPFAATLYAPLYSYLVEFLCMVAGYGYNDLHGILVVARVVSFLAMFVNIYFIYKLFQLFKLPVIYFLFGVAFYLLLITGHFYVTRPDALKTTLITIFSYTTLRYLFFEGKKLHLFFAVLSALLAVYLKQDAILNVYLILIPACLYLRNRKSYFLTGAFTACLLVSVLICAAVFGKHFFTNTVLLNFQSLTDVKNSINILIILFSAGRNIPLLLLGLLGCYLALKNRRHKQAEHFIPIIAVLTFLATHAGMIRVGSYLNYSFEAILLLIVNAAFVLRYFEQTLARHQALTGLLAFTYLVALFASNTIIHSYSYDKEREAALEQEYHSMMAMEDTLAAVTKGELIFFPNEKYTACYPDLPMILGHDFHRGRFIDVYHGLHAPSRLSFISGAEYDAWFTDGRVKYIIADDNERSRIHVAKYYPHYAYQNVLNNLRIYKYRDS